VVNYLLISGEAGQVGKNLVMPVEASLSMLLQAENKQEKATIKKATLLFQKKKEGQHCTYTCRPGWIGWAN